MQGLRFTSYRLEIEMQVAKGEDTICGSYLSVI